MDIFTTPRKVRELELELATSKVSYATQIQRLTETNAVSLEHLKEKLAAQEEEIIRLQEQNEQLRKTNKFLKKQMREADEAQRIERLQVDGDHRRQVATLEAELRAAVARADVAQANFEWNRLMFNKSEAERSTLMQHTLRAPLMPFELAREPVAADDKPKPIATSASDSAVAVPVGPATRTAIGGLATALGIDFEDVGDDMARELGVSNDNPEGELQHV